MQEKRLMLTGQAVLAAAGTDKTPTKFSMIAYTGEPIMQWWSEDPLVVDLAGIKASENGPIYMGHNRAVGHWTKLENDGKTLTLEGIVSRNNADSRDVDASLKNGFPWQASIGGANDMKTRYVQEGETLECNGRTYAGPCLHVQEVSLAEVSFVEYGADGKTSAEIAATAAQQQTGGNTMTDDEKKKIGAEKAEAAKAAEIKAKADQEKAIDAARSETDKAIKAERDRAIAEAKRCDALRKIEDITAARLKKAIEGEEDARDVELEIMRASRPDPKVGIFIHSAPSAEGDVMTAAIVQAGGMPRTAQEKYLKAETLEKAHDAFRGKMGLQQMIVMAARRNGYTGDNFLRDHQSMRAAIKAAFSSTDFGSTIGNAMNMFIMDAFNSVENAWQKIADVNANVNDYREYETYADISDLTFLDLAPQGKIKHGEAKDLKYTNQLDTKARIVQIDRKDIINDSIGIINAMAAKLGRGGAIALNRTFWKTFLDNSANFWSVARGNLVLGKGLDNDGLEAAFRAFNEQTDPNGDPLGVTAKYLVCGPDLQWSAKRFEKSEVVVATGDTNAVIGAANVFSGLYETVMSQYQTTAGEWYLVADPNVLPAVEVGFLRGARMPTVEAVGPDADELGIAMRGYYDFGVSKQVYQGAVKVTSSES